MLIRHKFLRVVAVVAVLSAVPATGLLVLLRPDPPLSALPAATTASFGRAGDPLNIALVGDKETIARAFLVAHWLVPDATTASTSLKIAEASLANAAYATAPVSNLYLFGRAQDLAFELPTNSVRQRHHARLWQTTMTVSGKALWIGSATYDAGIELSGRTALPTHHISANVDAERDFTAQSLLDTGLFQNATSERLSYPTLWGRNGGGDWYFDDGLVRVLASR